MALVPLNENVHTFGFCLIYCFWFVPHIHILNSYVVHINNMIKSNFSILLHSILLKLKFICSYCRGNTVDEDWHISSHKNNIWNKTTMCWNFFQHQRKQWYFVSLRLNDTEKAEVFIYTRNDQIQKSEPVCESVLEPVSNARHIVIVFL